MKSQEYRASEDSDGESDRIVTVEDRIAELEGAALAPAAAVGPAPGMLAVAALAVPAPAIKAVAAPPHGEVLRTRGHKVTIGESATAQ